MKKYSISWEERHIVEVEAENEEDAMEKVHTGDYDTNDEDVGINAGFDVAEI